MTENADGKWPPTPVHERRLPYRRNVRWRGDRHSRFEPVSQLVGAAADVYYAAMMQQPVEHGRGNHRVTHQLSPVAEVLVAGENDTAALISLANQAKQQLRLLTVQLKITDDLPPKFDQAKC